ncbi:MAG: hypothetical protein RLZ56_1395 [Bacteroidota bacterium]|jgi:hypothetical protein
MKYPKTSISIVVLAIIAFIYFYIPNTIVLQEKTVLANTSTSITRGLMNTKKWKEWMPAKLIQQNEFQFEHSKLNIQETLISSANTVFTYSDTRMPLTFSVYAIGKDSCSVGYETSIDNRHLSPLVRLQNYWLSIRAKQQIHSILSAATNYYTGTKGIYGFEIVEDRVKDSVLISTHKSFTDTPNLVQLYGMIHLLETHIQKNNGIIHGAPMVNITRLGEKEVFAQVAYPLAAMIPEAANLEIKKMVLGNILTTKVNGDQQKVNQAFLETQNYIHDHLRMSPAIPFVVYNTNRLQEQNAQKWESTIYYPVY